MGKLDLLQKGFITITLILGQNQIGFNASKSMKRSTRFGIAGTSVVTVVCVIQQVLNRIYCWISHESQTFNIQPASHPSQVLRQSENKNKQQLANPRKNVTPLYCVSDKYFSAILPYPS